MLKFGSVTIDVSHPRTFAKVLAKGERARYVGVFNDCFRTNEEVKTFADTFGVKPFMVLFEVTIPCPNLSRWLLSHPQSIST